MWVREKSCSFLWGRGDECYFGGPEKLFSKSYSFVWRCGKIQCHFRGLLKSYFYHQKLSLSKKLGFRFNRLLKVIENIGTKSFLMLSTLCKSLREGFTCRSLNVVENMDTGGIFGVSG